MPMVSFLFTFRLLSVSLLLYYITIEMEMQYLLETDKKNLAKTDENEGESFGVKSSKTQILSLKKPKIGNF